MCAVSMIMDHYGDKWRDRLPNTMPYEQVPQTPQQPWSPEDIARIFQSPVPAITKDEIEEFRRLLERAREYDRRNNEPECELESKKAAVLAIAKQLGVEISFL
ncbi:MAG: hypothetical protein GEV06_19860 [Luteitalea sp.]|nr:hypothetical protein [Luteitalea sp.]